MASFASLPPELVEEIVELALPPFSPSGWRGLLYREMVVGSFAAIVELAVQFSSQSSLPPVAFLRIEQTRVYNLSLWGGRASVAGDVVAGQVVEKTKATVVSLVGWSGSDLTGIQGVQSLSFVDSRLQAWNFSSQRSKLVFVSLHRLHFHDVDFDSLYDVLTSDAFPNLVSLALASCYVTREWDSQGSAWSDSPPLSDPVYLTKDYVPLLPQLRAAAVAYAGGFGDGGAFEVLEILHAYRVEYIYRRLPRCLRVLRLHAEQYWPLEPKRVLSLLTLADLPVLSELHLVSFALDKVKVSGDFVAVEEWCQEKQVTLFLYPMDDLDSFTPSFWRFLDGVTERLGLDV
ncbi:hypothetical protein JCM10213v2_007948 [Rhodosporidiobolus nylandii]